MKDVIREAVSEALNSLGITETDFAIEHPTDLSHGDYACNVALIVAKQVGKSPKEVAEGLRVALVDQIEYVAKIEVAGPGFLNFHLHRDFFIREIVRIKELGDKWGANNTEAGEVVLVEYTSPNLFKPLHVGNLVGNIIGESLTRLFEFSGALVKRLNYPSDIGLTVAKGVWGLQSTSGNPDNINDLGKAYVVGNSAYEAGGEAKLEIEAVNRALYAGSDPVLMDLRERGIKTSRAGLESICQKLGTKFDLDIPESEASPVGTQIVKDNLAQVFEESDGAVVYKGEKVGLHTRVFLNSQGLPTYEAKDLGNFNLKQKAYPDWKKSLVVTGNEQAEYFKVIFAAIKEIWPEVSEKEMQHIPTGFLTLTTGKMSSRTGNVLTGESIIADLETEANTRAESSEVGEMVAIAALKYQILKHGVGSNIVFDKEKALSFEGDSGPYLQYTYARINSVLDKAGEANIVASRTKTPEDAYMIERLVYRFPEVIEDSLIDREPHQVITFLTELASAFNSFYAAEKIADVSDEFAPYKVALAGAVATTLKNGLWVLGIKTPEKM